MNTFIIRIFTSLLLILSLTAIAYAEDISIGKKVKIDSEILGETRELMISLPKDYGDSTYGFPVLYFTDAQNHFQSMSSTVHFLTSNNLIPPVITVGIVTSSNRVRDLTPSISGEALENSPWLANQEIGGADNFLRFFTAELIPFIQKQYRTSGYDVFSGHSYGGLFAFHAWHQKPKLFDGIIAVSPSLWWDDKELISETKSLLEADKLAIHRIFISKGNEGGVMPKVYEDVVDILTQYKGEQLTAQEFPDETHNSVVYRANYFGLKALFVDWSLSLEDTPNLDTVKAHNEKVKNTYNLDFTSERWITALGNRQLYQKEYDKAVQTFLYAIKLFPESAYSHFRLAKTFEAKENTEKAFEYFKKADGFLPETSPFKKLYQENIERVEKLLNQKL